MGSREEVDEVMEQAAEAGATIVKPAEETFLGRIFRVFSGSGWAFMGSGVEPGF